MFEVQENGGCFECHLLDQFVQEPQQGLKRTTPKRSLSATKAEVSVDSQKEIDFYQGCSNIPRKGLPLPPPLPPVHCGPSQNWGSPHPVFPLS